MRKSKFSKKQIIEILKEIEDGAPVVSRSQVPLGNVYRAYNNIYTFQRRALEREKSESLLFIILPLLLQSL